MPAPKTANGLQVETRFSLEGQNVENVYHIITPSGTPPGTHMTTVAAIFEGWWSSAMRGNFSSVIALREIYVVDLTLEDGPTHTRTPATPIAGGHPDPALPNNVALCATKRTNQRGRAYRGRTYYAGIPETVVTGSFISTAYASDVNADLVALLDLLADDEYTLGVLSKALNKAWRAVGVITPVSTFALRDLRTDSQRGRLPE